MRLMAVTLLLLSLAQGAAVSAVQSSATAEPVRRMAVTVDDLPASRSHALSLAQQQALTRRLLATLDRHGVPAVGFVNEVKLEVDGQVDPARVALLESWLDAGFELGNHGYAHLDLHRVPPAEWMQDVLRGERVIRPLMEAQGQAVRWFRYPSCMWVDDEG